MLGRMVMSAGAARLPPATALMAVAGSLAEASAAVAAGADLIDLAAAAPETITAFRSRHPGIPICAAGARPMWCAMRRPRGQPERYCSAAMRMRPWTAGYRSTKSLSTSGPQRCPTSAGPAWLPWSTWIARPGLQRGITRPTRVWPPGNARRLPFRPRVSRFRADAGGRDRRDSGAQFLAGRESSAHQIPGPSAARAGHDGVRARHQAAGPNRPRARLRHLPRLCAIGAVRQPRRWTSAAAVCQAMSHRCGSRTTAMSHRCCCAGRCWRWAVVALSGVGAERCVALSGGWRWRCCCAGRWCADRVWRGGVMASGAARVLSRRRARGNGGGPI